MDSYVWTHHLWSTNKNFYSPAVCGHWMLAEDAVWIERWWETEIEREGGREGGRNRERVKKPVLSLRLDDDDVDVDFFKF